MELWYEGTDITDMVQIKSCIVRDTVGRCDALEIDLENAAKWYSWGTDDDDVISVTHNGYDSGDMYVSHILPEDGRYKIYATSLPCKSRAMENKSYNNMTLGEIMKQCAMRTSMDYALYGVDENILVPYIQQEQEGSVAFLERLLELESATLKCVNGKYAAIGIEYAQQRDALQTLEITAEQAGVFYRRTGKSYYSLTMKSPFGEAMAIDTAVSSDHTSLVCSGIYPIMSDVQAGRWAKGRLLAFNRLAETLTVEQALNIGLTALSRMDVTGSTDASGEWMAYEVEHDLVNEKSRTLFRRVIDTIQ